MMQGRGKMGGNFRNARMNGKENGHEGFGIMPEGMWWKSPMVVQRLTLTPDQVGRMDGIFEKSRIELIDLKANLEKQNVYLEPILSANPTDTAKAMLQIDKVADARADLEKANARMLLGIRSVLTPEQWTKLSAHRGPGKFGGPEGAGAPGGFGPGGFGAGHGPHGPGVNDFVAPDPQF
jgi:Spy/CpxP family protein refolding chaperone